MCNCDVYTNIKHKNTHNSIRKENGFDLYTYTTVDQRYSLFDYFKCDITLCTLNNDQCEIIKNTNKYGNTFEVFFDDKK